MTVHDDSSNILLNALSECWPGIVITGFVVIANGMDDDGDHRTYTDTFEDQTAPRTLGMLEAGCAIEKERIVREWLAPG